MKTISFSKSIVFSALCLFLFSHCGQESDSNKEVSLSVDYASPADEAVSESSDGSASSAAAAPISIERKLTKEGMLTWETDDVNKTHEEITAQVKKIKGYIANDNQVRDEYQIRNTIELRIPSAQFDSFLADLSVNVRKFDEKVIKVIDVTEEYIDVTARLKTKKELEQHYYDLLKQTKNVGEVLQVEEQLNNVRTEIESAEGRLKYLNDRVSTSTVYLTFYETTSGPVGFFGEIGKSFVDGWKGLLYFILGAIRAWPLLLLIAFVLFWFIRRRIRK
jgi:hypothetical protein